MRLTFANCKEYNTPGDAIALCGEDSSKLFESKLRVVFPDFCGNQEDSGSSDGHGEDEVEEAGSVSLAMSVEEGDGASTVVLGELAHDVPSDPMTVHIGEARSPPPSTVALGVSGDVSSDQVGVGASNAHPLSQSNDTPPPVEPSSNVAHYDVSRGGTVVVHAGLTSAAHLPLSSSDVTVTHEVPSPSTELLPPSISVVANSAAAMSPPKSSPHERDADAGLSNGPHPHDGSGPARAGGVIAASASPPSMVSTEMQVSHSDAPAASVHTASDSIMMAMQPNGGGVSTVSTTQPLPSYVSGTWSVAVQPCAGYTPLGGAATGDPVTAGPCGVSSTVVSSQTSWAPAQLRAADGDAAVEQTNSAAGVSHMDTSGPPALVSLDQALWAPAAHSVASHPVPVPATHIPAVAYPNANVPSFTTAGYVVGPYGGVAPPVTVHPTSFFSTVDAANRGGGGARPYLVHHNPLGPVGEAPPVPYGQVGSAPTVPYSQVGETWFPTKPSADTGASVTQLPWAQAPNGGAPH